MNEGVGQRHSKNNSTLPTKTTRHRLFSRGASKPHFQESRVPNASLFTVLRADNPEDPGGVTVINRLTSIQVGGRGYACALHLFKLPAIGHGGHHLRELLLLTLKYTVNMLHWHLQEQGPQVRQAPHALLLLPQPSNLARLLILETAQQESR